MVMSDSISRAMSRQIKRVNAESALADELRALQLEIARLERENDDYRRRLADLERENDTLAARAGSRRAFSPSLLAERGLGGEVLRINNRPVVNQTEAGRLLNVKQYQISRWVAAGHFQTVTVGARTLIYADTLHKPAPKSRKKKGTVKS